MNDIPVKQTSAGMGRMSGRIRQLGTSMVIRMTSGICDRGRLNAQLAGALEEARAQDWREALAVYRDERARRRPQIPPRA